MALSTTQIDTNRGTSGIVLPLELANEVWGKVPEESAIMQLSPRIDIPGSGETVPLITAEPTAAWVTESTEKAVSKATLSNKTIKTYKLSVIELFSNEFRRDMPRVYDELVRRLPRSIGKKFDETVFKGVTPGTGFDVLTSATAVSIAGANGGAVYQNIVTAFTTIGAQGYAANGWVVAPQAMAVLLSAIDGNGRPLFIDSIRDDNRVGMILGGEVINNSHVYAAGAAGNPATPNQVGVAGDWNQARWGYVNPGLTVAISDQATINDGTNQVNLWQRNMFAVRVECEIGFAAFDANAFVRLTTPYS